MAGAKEPFALLGVETEEGDAAEAGHDVEDGFELASCSWDEAFNGTG